MDNFDTNISQPDQITIHAWADNWIFHLAKGHNTMRPWLVMTFWQAEEMAIRWLEFRGFTVENKRGHK